MGEHYETLFRIGPEECRICQYRDARFFATMIATGSATAFPQAYAVDVATFKSTNVSALGAALFEVKLMINETERVATVAANTTLLDCLRDVLHLTGAKKGCALGHCGACTVLIDGRRVNACLTLAVMQEGHQITTIEGLEDEHGLHRVQSCFIEHDGFQCGYCTPGQIMSAVGCIAEGHTTSDAESQGVDERQYLPMWRISQHCCGSSRRCEGKLT